MVKADIKEAYRMVPIHPQDQPLLGIMWEDSLYIDKTLPFGLRLAPKIFLQLQTQSNGFYIKKELDTSSITWMTISRLTVVSHAAK